MEYFESNGIQLAGILEGLENAPIVVMGHGLSSNKDCSTNSSLSQVLNKEGIATFRFDFFAHGDSEGNFPELTPSIGVKNALDAVKFVQSKGHTKIAYFGGSYGGYVGYFVGSKLPELFAVVVKCPVADFGEIVGDLVEDSMEDWQQQGYSYYFSHDLQKKVRLNYTFAADSIANPAYTVLANLEPQTLIIHGDNDTTVPLDQSKKAAELIPHCMLAVIDGADHLFESESTFQKMIQLASAFLIEHAR